MPLLAEVAELADATDSKSVARKGVWVRVPPSVRSGSPPGGGTPISLPPQLNSKAALQFFPEEPRDPFARSIAPQLLDPCEVDGGGCPQFRPIPLNPTSRAVLFERPTLLTHLPSVHTSFKPTFLGPHQWRQHNLVAPLTKEGGGAPEDQKGPTVVGYPHALKTVQELTHLLGGSIRLELLLTLHNGPRPVTEIAQQLELSLAHISHNLALLRSADLVTLTPVGRVHLYALSGLVTATLSDQEWTLTASLPSGESVSLASCKPTSHQSARSEPGVGRATSASLSR